MTYQDLKDGGVTYKGVNVYLTSDEYNFQPIIMIRFGNHSRYIPTTHIFMEGFFDDLIKEIDENILTIQPLMRRKKINKLKEIIR